jgi:uncharacterized protein (UPF0548 family)
MSSIGSDRSIRLRRPSEAEIADFLARDDLAFSHPEVGATGELDAPLPDSLTPTYDLDHHRFPLGTGRELFERACGALGSWQQFEIPWLELHGGSSPVHRGQAVATLTRVLGLWFLNPCRVVYARFPAANEAVDVCAFAYGTLEGHVECGEERFVVRYDPASGVVHYEVAAFSRPAVLLTRLGYPLARRLQRQFAAASAEAMTRAVR